MATATREGASENGSDAGTGDLFGDEEPEFDASPNRIMRVMADSYKAIAKLLAKDERRSGRNIANIKWGYTNSEVGKSKNYTAIYQDSQH